MSRMLTRNSYALIEVPQVLRNGVVSMGRCNTCPKSSRRGLGG